MSLITASASQGKKGNTITYRINGGNWVTSEVGPTGYLNIEGAGNVYLHFKDEMVIVSIGDTLEISSQGIQNVVGMYNNTVYMEWGSVNMIYNIDLDFTRETRYGFNIGPSDHPSSDFTSIRHYPII